jgi:two-component system response regulator AtoC
MQHFLRVARRVVRSDSPLLILGETGVGKERLARSIHSESRRSAGPFITVNCGALPETLLESELFGHEEGAFTGATRARRGYFELAHHGTIFLDEIGEMPLHLQVKLLRVLEDRNIRRVGSERPVEIDVRIMAATNRDVKLAMEQDRFRADLYYRLAVVALTVPPLRDRREDIPALARMFLARSGKQFGRSVSRFDPDALRALVEHDWPGNVRELINVIERAVLLAREDVIHLEDLRGTERYFHPITSAAPTPERPPSAVDVDQPLARARREIVEDFELRYLRSLLTKTGGRIGETAKRAGVNERTLYGMMRRYDLRKEDFKH